MRATLGITFPTVLFFLLFTNSSSIFTDTHQDQDVIMTPFLALYKLPKDLHLVQYYFQLVQHVDLAPVISLLHNISFTFSMVKNTYEKQLHALEKGHNHSILMDLTLEKRINTLLQTNADTLSSGRQLFRHSKACPNIA